MPAKVTLVADCALSAAVEPVWAAAPVALLDAAALQGTQWTGGWAAVAVHVMSCAMALSRGGMLVSLPTASGETQLLWLRTVLWV